MEFSKAVADERAPYTDDSRARLALSAAASILCDSARDVVPILADKRTGLARPDEVLADEIEEVARLVDQAEEVLTAMVIYAAISGATWKAIGDGLGKAKQNAHTKYRQAVEDFRAGLADPDADTDAARDFRTRYAAARKPDTWAPRLDKWVEQHWDESSRSLRDPLSVSSGLTRLSPLAELTQIGARRTALLKQHLVPPAEKVLPLAERELELLQQLAAAGHDLADDVTHLRRQIAELRATMSAPANPAADSPE